MDLNKPLVSIIMPAYNVEEYIARAIQSIIDQTETNWELIICDDASTDKTIEIIESFKDDRIITFKNKKNKGNLETSLFLYSKTKGTYFTLQDADDFSHPNRIEKQVKELLKDDELGMVGGNYEVVSKVEFPVRCGFYPLKDAEIKKLMLTENPPMHCSVMVRRELIEKHGYYRKFFNRIGAADYDWMYRISEKTKVSNLREVLYYYYFNPVSFTKKKTNNLLKHHSEDIAIFLAKQRRSSNGEDALTRNSEEEITEFLIAKFIDLSSKYFWNNNKSQAFNYANWALKLKINRQTVRHYLYILRKSIFLW